MNRGSRATGSSVASALKEKAADMEAGSFRKPASTSVDVGPSDRVFVCKAAPWCCVWSLFNVMATIALGYFVLHNSSPTGGGGLGAVFGGPQAFKPRSAAAEGGAGAPAASDANAVALRGAAAGGDPAKCPGPAPAPGADGKAPAVAAAVKEKVIYVPQIGCEPVDKLMVISYTNEDISWVDLYFPDMPHIVYASNTSDAAHHQPSMIGREAGNFLQFIIDYYDHLPDLVIFVHGHRYAYHTYYRDIVRLLRAIRWDKAKERGFTPLNLNEFHSLNLDYHNWQLLREVLWKQYFTEISEEPPGAGEAYCCAQFITTRERILLRSRSFYEGLLDFVMDTSVRRDQPRILEHTWHIILGEPVKQPQIDACQIVDCSLQTQWAS